MIIRGISVMKKTVRLLSILLAAMLMLSSCNFEISGGSYTGNDYLYVKGTAVKNEKTGLYEFASADIEVDYTDITGNLVPVDSDSLHDSEEDNVMFRCENTRFSFIRYVSTPKIGYEFDQWKVRKLSDVVNTEDEYSYEYRKAKEAISEAEKYLDESTGIGNFKIQNRYSPTLEMLDIDLLPYIYPEYNRAPVVIVPVNKADPGYHGNGTEKTPYTLDEFRILYGNCKEINAIVRVKDTLANNDLSKFFTELSHLSDYPGLEEVHVKLAKPTSTNADIGSLLDRFGYVDLENIRFNSINLTNETSTSWKFKNCHFDSLTVKTGNDVVLENCTYDNLWKIGNANVTVR